MKGKMFLCVLTPAVLILCGSVVGFPQSSFAEIRKLEVPDTDHIRDILTRNAGTPVNFGHLAAQLNARMQANLRAVRIQKIG